MPLYEDAPEWEAKQSEQVVIREVTWREQIVIFLKWCLILPMMGFVFIVALKLIGRVHDAVLSIVG